MKILADACAQGSITWCDILHNILILRMAMELVKEITQELVMIQLHLKKAHNNCTLVVCNRANDHNGICVKGCHNFTLRKPHLLLIYTSIGASLIIYCRKSEIVSSLNKWL